MSNGDRIAPSVRATEGQAGVSFGHADGQANKEAVELDDVPLIDETGTSGRQWTSFVTQVPKAVWNSGMSCMAIASFFQSGASLCVKLTDGRVPVFQIVAIRSGICMAVTMCMIRWAGIRPMFGHPESFIALLFRGGAGAASMSVYYFAILLLPLADVLTIFFTHPAIVVALAWLCKGEAIRWTGLLGMLLSLLGVVAVAQPPFLTGGSDWSSNHIKGVAEALLAAILAAVAFVAIRYVPKKESSLSIALSFHTLGVVTSVIPLAAGIPGPAVIPGLKDWIYLLAIAFCSVTSHAFIAKAFQVECAGKAAAVGYLQVVFGYLYGIFLFHDPNSVLSISGSIVICIGVVAVSWPLKSDTVSEVEAPKPDLEDATVVEMAPLVEQPVHSGKEAGAPR